MGRPHSWRKSKVRGFGCSGRDVALGEGNFDVSSAPRCALEAEDNLESSRFDAARGGLDDRHGGASEGDVAPRLGQRAIEGVEKFVEFPTDEGIHVFRCAAGQSNFVFQVVDARTHPVREPVRPVIF